VLFIPYHKLSWFIHSMLHLSLLLK
jgi:hypothetical protein